MLKVHISYNMDRICVVCVIIVAVVGYCCRQFRIHSFIHLCLQRNRSIQPRTYKQRTFFLTKINTKSYREIKKNKMERKT